MPPPPRPSPARDQLEIIIGGNLFNRIGAIALLIGVAFLLKYSFEHNWVTPWMRVTIGFIAGLALLFLGDYFHRKEMRVFAQGITGAGIAILYLSAYASLNIYHLVSQIAALVLMSAVTVIAILQSLRYGALVVSLIGLLGGFLTPLILNSSGGGDSNTFGLFAYLTLLDIGLLAVALKKDSWAVIEPLALAGTYLTYLVWNETYYHGGKLAILSAFLTIFWALFYLIDVYRSAKTIPTYPILRLAVSAFNALFYYLAMYFLINPKHHDWMGLITLAIGVVYFLTVLAFRNRPSLVPRYTITAIAFLVIATAVQYSGFQVVTLWALEALALVAAGLHWKMRYVWISAMGLFTLALITLFSTDGAFSSSSLAFVVNVRFLAYVILAASLLISAVSLKKLDADGAERLPSVLHYAWSALLFIAFTVEINDVFKAGHVQIDLGMKCEVARIMAMTVMWALYSIPLMWVGLSRKVTPLLYTGLAALAFGAVLVAAAGSEFEPLDRFVLIANIRTIAFLIVLIGMLTAHYMLENRREEYGWARNMLVILQIGIALLGFELLTVETLDYFHRLKEYSPRSMVALDHDIARVLVLAAIWSVYSVLLGWYGHRRNMPALLYSGLGVLGVGVLTAAGGGFDFDQIKNFRFVMGFRAAAFVIVIVSALVQQWWLGRRSSEYNWGVVMSAIIQVGASLLVFELLTAETWDYFERSIFLKRGTEAWNTAKGLVDLRQMIISVVWLVYSIALMGYGIARRVKTVRFVALSLFWVTILKVFLYDLSSLGTLYRIFSFMGLGLILLATSYLCHRFKHVILGTPPEVQPEA